MDTLIGLRDKKLIKVLTGVRRCGKSTVMRMFCDYLLKDGISDSQILFINFEEIENYKWINNFEGLYYHIINNLDLSKPCYVFLDEVQHVKEYERLVDGLFTKPAIDVYISLIVSKISSKKTS